MSAKFRYIGEYPNEAQSLAAYGVVFTPDVVCEIAERFVSKARNNRFFQEVRDEVPALTVGESAEEDAPLNRLLGDALGKDTLIAKAEELGVKIDKRWKPERIAEAIESADV